jgi:hypothetical protein
LNITISEQAKTYLEKKNINCLTLNMKRAGLCCGSVSTPTVEYTEPVALNDYVHYLVNNINVYIDKLVKSEIGELKFVFKNLLTLKYIDVEGIKLL